MPVMCVVLISARDSLEITAFCKPMMKHSSITVTGTTSPSIVASRAPSKPKTNSNSASSNSGNAYSLWSWWRRATFTITAEQAAPRTKASTAAAPPSNNPYSLSATWSAIAETMPVMCDVYCATAKKPPALVAPATKVRVYPRRRFPSAVRSRPARLLA